MAVTNVSTAFPDVELAAGSTITVDTGDAAALVTQLNVYGISPVTGEPVEVTAIPPLFTYAPDAV